jgi:hypothetical protein
MLQSNLLYLSGASISTDADSAKHGPIRGNSPRSLKFEAPAQANADVAKVESAGVVDVVVEGLGAHALAEAPFDVGAELARFRDPGGNAGLNIRCKPFANGKVRLALASGWRVEAAKAEVINGDHFAHHAIGARDGACSFVYGDGKGIAAELVHFGLGESNGEQQGDVLLRKTRLAGHFQLWILAEERFSTAP